MLAVGSAGAAPPSPEERAAIDRRLARIVEVKGQALTIEEGDTILLEVRELVPASRFTRKLGEYEGAVLGIGAPKGIVVHPRADELRLEPQGDKVAATLRYAIHADPGSAGLRGARLELTPTVLERTGLANSVAQMKRTFAVAVVPAKAPKPAELAADFWGYRLYHGLASAKAAALAKKGVPGLSLADQGRVPSLDRASAELAAEVHAFERDRRRTWVAHRHLIAARTLQDPKVASLAGTYLANLDKPAEQLRDLPDVAIVEGQRPPPSDPIPPSGGQASGATLKPERVEPASGGKAGEGGDTLAPAGAYELGSDADDDEPIPAPGAPAKDPAPAPAEAKGSAPGQPVTVATGGGEGEAAAPRGGEQELPDDDLLAARKAREIPIPSYPRSLVLDDPNVAHDLSVRFSFASIDLRGASAITPAIFYHGQLGITRAIGLEVTVPTALVSVDVERAQSVYVMGNPLVSAKYRLYLPEVEGRRPALTLRARWAIPISPLNNIPPTQLGAEEFSFPAHFVDTYAFLLEKTDLGLGVNAAWQVGMIYAGVQVYGDYFLPVSTALDQTSFPTLSYGVSAGVLPLGDLLGVYLEGRATSLFSGPTRTEFFTYLGARGRFADSMEVAAWGSLPIGSVARVSSIQFGFELRVAYDVVDVVTIGRTGSREADLLE